MLTSLFWSAATCYHFGRRFHKRWLDSAKSIAKAMSNKAASSRRTPYPVKAFIERSSWKNQPYLVGVALIFSNARRSMQATPAGVVEAEQRSSWKDQPAPISSSGRWGSGGPP